MEGGSSPSLTSEEVARRAGVTRERVDELVAVGVLAEPFRSGDPLRVQLVDELETFGVAPAAVAEAIATGSLSLSYLDRFPPPPPRADKTHEQLCDELGIPFRLLERIYAGFGLPRPRGDGLVRADDVAVVSGLPLLFQSGLDEGEVLRAARVWGEGLRRVAEHQVRSFHELIEEPFRRQGLSDDQALVAALSESAFACSRTFTRSSPGSTHAISRARQSSIGSTTSSAPSKLPVSAAPPRRFPRLVRSRTCPDTRASSTSSATRRRRGSPSSWPS
jgi:hypothetical protein